jgi:hypothetical protein
MIRDKMYHFIDANGRLTLPATSFFFLSHKLTNSLARLCPYGNAMHRDELVAKLKAAVDADPSSTESLRHTLELAHHDVARGLFARCFETVNSFPIEGATADTQDRAVLLSQLWTLKGAELQLKSGIFSARQLYNTALALDPQNLEASLKLASIHLELGETAEVNYDGIGIAVHTYTRLPHT